LIIFPQFFDCESQGRSIELPNGKTIPMKCHWSAIAEIGVGVPLLASGIVFGTMAALIPTYLIGVCGIGTMICRQVMLPSILLASGLIIVASIAVIIIAATRKDSIAVA
jgi:hypothetical protein